MGGGVQGGGLSEPPEPPLDPTLNRMVSILLIFLFLIKKRMLLVLIRRVS